MKEGISITVILLSAPGDLGKPAVEQQEVYMTGVPRIGDTLMWELAEWRHVQPNDFLRVISVVWRTNSWKSPTLYVVKC